MFLAWIATSSIRNTVHAIVMLCDVMQYIVYRCFQSLFHHHYLCCESLKFEGGALIVVLPWEHFSVECCKCSALQWSWSDSILFAHCWMSSCVNRFLSVFQNYSGRFALPGMKGFNELAMYCGGAYSSCKKCWNHGWRTHYASAANSFICHGGHAPYNLYRELWSCDSIVQIGYCLGLA